MKFYKVQSRLNQSLIQSIQKIYQGIFLNKLLKFYSKPKLIKTKKVFIKSLNTPKWLGWTEIEDLQKKYPFIKTFSYEDEGINQRAKYRALNILKLIKSDKKNINNFLELGCGHGMVSYFLYCLGKKTTGIDIKICVDKKIKTSSVTYLEMDATNLKFNKESFDFVYSYDAFEHFLKPEKILQEAIKVTKIRGYIYLCFGPLYMAPWGAHAYNTITFPYWQFLFPKELIEKFIKAKNLPQLPNTTFNKWSIEEFRKLWKKYSNELKVIKYEEILDTRYLNLVRQYPSCFKSKTNNFEDLIVTSIKILFQKIN